MKPKTHEEIYNRIYFKTKMWMMMRRGYDETAASSKANVIAVLMTHTAFIDQFSYSEKRDHV
jgi:hypothetical protein